MKAIYETSFQGLNLVKRGKVRDIYDLGEHLLIVATDRLSAFDVVMPQPIPYKGMVLTQMSNYWFEHMQDILPNHLVSTQVEDFPTICFPHREAMRGRTILVRKTKPLPIECVVRGYISGSGWKEYQESGTVCGIQLPEGMKESARLPEPIFTPATKADVGHDENIDFDRAASLAGHALAEEAREYAVSIYNRAYRMAAERGIIIADTKMEFGQDARGKLILIDELLTPDSSRFWEASRYTAGTSQESFDKQYVRDYLISVKFNKRPPGPQLPAEVIEKTSHLYREALRRITGRDVEKA